MSFIREVFQMNVFIRVVFHQEGFSSGYSFIRKVCHQVIFHHHFLHQKSLSSLVCHQGDLSSLVFLIWVFYHQEGLSSVVVFLIRVMFHQSFFIRNVFELTEDSTVLTTVTLSVSCLPPLCLLAQVHFHTLSELKAHATLLHNTDLSVCSQCPLVFVRDTSLLVHVREAHGGVDAKSYRCKTCDSKFDNKRLLMFHKRHVCPSACVCVCV